ncbi:TNT domain-containing protein [Nocardiopsis halophila]|uniref:TNT domain-containing protein n=1 Tax=Nocardiopsis halophila TaxID=141692 RepID=UPI0003462EE9|nr:TNT domain-containing protein [Nocardiopsis halophila]
MPLLLARSLGVASSLALVWAVAPAGPAAAAPADPPPLPDFESPCPVGDAPPTDGVRGPHLCGDARLGPEEIPEEGVVGDLVEDYDRLGRLNPVAFLARHWERGVDPDTGEPREGWDYPPHEGFEVVDGEPVKEVETLAEGEVLDRFGSPWGSYLAPAGAPFAQRSLPPDALNTWEGGAEHNYLCYVVDEPFEAQVGPIAPAFEQPGGGEQVLLDPALVPEAEGDDVLGADSLVEWGYIDERPAEDCAPDDADRGDGADDAHGAAAAGA